MLLHCQFVGQVKVKMEGGPRCPCPVRHLSTSSTYSARWARSGPRLRSLTPYLAPSILVLSSPQLARIPAELGIRRKRSCFSVKWTNGAGGETKTSSQRVSILMPRRMATGGTDVWLYFACLGGDVWSEDGRWRFCCQCKVNLCFENGIGSFQWHE